MEKRSRTKREANNKNQRAYTHAHTYTHAECRCHSSRTHHKGEDANSYEIVRVSKRGAFVDQEKSGFGSLIVRLAIAHCACFARTKQNRDQMKPTTRTTTWLARISRQRSEQPAEGGTAPAK